MSHENRSTKKYQGKEEKKKKTSIKWIQRRRGGSTYHNRSWGMRRGIQLNTDGSQIFKRFVLVKNFNQKNTISAWTREKASSTKSINWQSSQLPTIIVVGKTAIEGAVTGEGKGVNWHRYNHFSSNGRVRSISPLYNFKRPSLQI